MGTEQAPQRDLFEKGEDENQIHPILSIPLVEKLLKFYLPDLKRQPSHYQALLNEISFYLLEQPKLRSKILKKELSEEFYLALYGLKTQLKHHNLRQVSFAVEIHKQQFGELLNDERQA